MPSLIVGAAVTFTVVASGGTAFVAGAAAIGAMIAVSAVKRSVDKLQKGSTQSEDQSKFIICKI